MNWKPKDGKTATPLNDGVPVGMKKAQIGRLAMREEGEFWNAYFADTESMEDALLLGSIRMTCVRGHPHRKDQFMAMMRGIIDQGVKELYDQDLKWNEPTPGPENER